LKKESIALIFAIFTLQKQMEMATFAG